MNSEFYTELCFVHVSSCGVVQSLREAELTTDIHASSGRRLVAVSLIVKCLGKENIFFKYLGVCCNILHL